MSTLIRSLVVKHTYKLYRSLSILITLLLISVQSMAQEMKLADFQWKNRVLLLDVQDLSHEAVNMHVRRSGWDGFKERDLVLLIHCKEVIYNAEFEVLEFQSLEGVLSENLEDQVYLIGKDGMVKLRAPIPLEDVDLFRRIDEMPMRRQEIKRRKSN